MSMKTSVMTGMAVALAAALATPAAQAQFYLGGEGGWTGLEGTSDNIGGVPYQSLVRCRIQRRRASWLPDGPVAV